MKRLLLLVLAAPAIASAQIFPSPTFNSLTLQNPLTAANGGTGATTSTGSGSVVLSNSPTLATPALGTPSSVTLTNGTGLPISTGVSGLGSGVATGLANAATGSGSPVLATSPTLTTPNLGTPSAVTLTNGTGLPISTGISGLGSGVAAGLGNIATGTGGPVLATSPTLAGAGDTAGLSVAGPILVGSSTVQTACDNTGATDATSCLNAAVSSAEAISNGGFLIIQPGTYKVSSTVAINSAVTVYAYGVTFKWGASAPGSCCTPIVKIGNPSTSTYSATFNMNVLGLTVDGNGTNNLYGFEWDTVRQSRFQDLAANNIAGTVVGASGPFAYYLTSTGTHQFNTSVNTFSGLQANGDWQGMALTGMTGATQSFSTVNTFVNTNLFNTTAFGIDFIQQCDSNYFYSTNVSTGISTGTWVGVRFNDGANSTTQDNDVNEEYFSGLTLSGGGSGSVSYGLDINYAFDILVDGYRQSSGGGTWSQLAIGGPASVVSYKVTNLTAPLITQYAAPAPTVTAGSAAGSSPPTPTINGNTLAGTITFGTGTSPTNGTQVNVTFPTQLPAAPKSIVFTPNNGSTYGLNLVPGSISSTGFVLYAINAPAASQGSTAYTINYVVTP